MLGIHLNHRFIPMSDNPFVNPPAPAFADIAPKDTGEKNLGLLCQLLALCAFIIPFGNVLGPLVIWLIKRTDSPYLDELGKEAVNFNISWLIYGIIAGLSIFVLIGIILAPAVLIAWLILVIIGAIKASEGKIYRFPLTIRFIK